MKTFNSIIAVVAIIAIVLAFTASETANVIAGAGICVVVFSVIIAAIVNLVTDIIKIVKKGQKREAEENS